jgi:hypothetical protein
MTGTKQEREDQRARVAADTVIPRLTRCCDPGGMFPAMSAMLVIMIGRRALLQAASTERVRMTDQEDPVYITMSHYDAMAARTPRTPIRRS